MELVQAIQALPYLIGKAIFYGLGLIGVVIFAALYIQSLDREKRVSSYYKDKKDDEYKRKRI